MGFRFFRPHIIAGTLLVAGLAGSVLADDQVVRLECEQRVLRTRVDQSAVSYSADSFMSAYYDFLRRPVSAPHGVYPEVALYFHEAEALSSARAARGILEVFKPDFFGKYPVSDELIRNSFSSPQVVKKLIPQAWATDHVAIFRGDVFSDHFFQDYAERNTRPLASDAVKGWRKLNQSQAWLEWDAVTRSFIPHTSGASARLLKSLGKPDDVVTLLRGAAAREADLFAFCRDMQGRSLAPSDLDLLISQTQSWYRAYDPRVQAFIQRLKSLRGEGQLSLSDSKSLLQESLALYRSTQLTDRYGSAFFATPDRDKASFFKNFYNNRKSELMSYRFKVSDLAKLLDEGKIYLGLEDGVIEIAFFDSDSSSALLQAYVPR